MTTKPKFQVEYEADVEELRAKRGKVRIEANYQIVDVRADDTMLWITLADERVIGTPLTWYPRLLEATADQRRNYRLWPRGDAIHWPDVDEDISVRVLMGHPS